MKILESDYKFTGTLIVFLNMFMYMYYVSKAIWRDFVMFDIFIVHTHL